MHRSSRIIISILMITFLILSAAGCFGPGGGDNETEAANDDSNGDGDNKKTVVDPSDGDGNGDDSDNGTNGAGDGDDNGTGDDGTDGADGNDTGDDDDGADGNDTGDDDHDNGNGDDNGTGDDDNDNGNDTAPATPPPATYPTTPPNGTATGVVASLYNAETLILESGEWIALIGLKAQPYDTLWGERTEEWLTMLVVGETVYLESDAEDQDYYGNSLRYVYLADRMVNAELLAYGYAHWYTAAPNMRYDSLFEEAEADARALERGFWAPAVEEVEIAAIHPDADGYDRDNLNDEYLILSNPAGTVLELEGWTLNDESNTRYHFVGTSLPPYGQLTLHTGSGDDTATHLYWGLSFAIWNNDRDAVFVRDAAGGLAAFSRYGGNGSGGGDDDDDDNDTEPGEFPPAGFPTSPPADATSARVESVYDGDTLTLESGEKVRIIGLNAPEHNKPWDAEAHERLEELVLGKQIWLEADIDDTDGWGRLLRYVYTDDMMVNLQLLYDGWVHWYPNEPNTRYDYEFEYTEELARDGERGIWQRSSYEDVVVIDTINEDAPGSDSSNLNGEYIVLRNTGRSAVNLGGWFLKDEATASYDLPSLSLSSGATVTIHSGSGYNSDTDLYWDNGYPVWNNGHDTAFLHDADGYLVAFERYGEH